MTPTSLFCQEKRRKYCVYVTVCMLSLLATMYVKHEDTIQQKQDVPINDSRSETTKNVQDYEIKCRFKVLNRMLRAQRNFNDNFKATNYNNST